MLSIHTSVTQKSATWAENSAPWKKVLLAAGDLEIRKKCSDYFLDVNSLATY